MYQHVLIVARQRWPEHDDKALFAALSAFQHALRRSCGAVGGAIASGGNVQFERVRSQPEPRLFPAFAMAAATPVICRAAPISARAPSEIASSPIM